MTAANDLSQLADVARNIADLTLVMASRTDETDGAYALQRLVLHDDVTSEFSGLAGDFVEKHLDDVVKGYDPTYKPDAHEMLVLKLSESALLESVVKEAARPNALQIFDEGSDFVDGLAFYVLTCRAKQKPLLLFRSYSPQKELTRSRLIALLHSRGVYNRIRRGLFVFDEKIDCFAWNGNLYIKNVHNFHTMFRYFEQLRASASATIDRVLAYVPISNAEDFKAACTGSIGFLAKVASISRKDYLASVTMADVEATIRDFGLEVKITEVRGKKLLEFASDLKHRWLILKLLDDDYLGSVMTKRRYEVNSKTAL
ncbi:MAG TPA: Kiwa anti-phage protein KwaB-like domain-containing protein [Candidatus Eremiobacteraceae bacterium]|nr:Kiwa anti-phage protein KwaB-like domain-containing protein [Candidatus Eremiobacteraceae bacterium]